jgi:hypothetical protein
VKKTLGTIAEGLSSLEKAGGNKEKAAAKKALTAVERVGDLMEYLFSTKQTLQDQTPK